MTRDLEADLPEVLSSFLQAVGDHFGRTGDWPEIEGLQRSLDHQGLNVDISDLRPNLDPDLGEIQNRVVWLTLHGLHDAGRLQEVDDYITALKLSYQRYADRAVEKAEIRAEDLDELGFDALRKKKLLVLLHQEGTFLGDGGGTGEDWHYTVTARVRDHAGVDSYETYVRVHSPRTGFVMATPLSTAPARDLHVSKSAAAAVGLYLRDSELLERCGDLLGASQNYDRAVREATVVLEDRVRKLAKTRPNAIGTTLMEQAFGPSNGKLRLRVDDNEQRGAMELFRGTVAYFRNQTGHRLVADYDQHDALEFVGFIDLLLTTLDRRLLPRRRVDKRSRTLAGSDSTRVKSEPRGPAASAKSRRDEKGESEESAHGQATSGRIVIRAGTERKFLGGTVGGPWFYSCSGAIRVYNGGPQRVTVNEGWWLAKDGIRVEAYVPRQATLTPGDPELLLTADRDDLVRAHEAHGGLVKMAVLLAGDDGPHEEKVPAGWTGELMTLQDRD